MIDQPASADELHIETLLTQKHSLWQVISWWFTGLLFIGGIFAVVFRFGELERLFDVIRNLKPEWIILAALVQALSYAAATGVWHQVLQYSGHPIAFRSLYPLSIAQLFAEQALPSNGLSGALLVVKGLLNRGVREPIGMGCMLVGMVSYYTAYGMAVIIAITILRVHSRLNFFFVAIAVIFGLLAVAVPASVLWLRYLNIHDRLPDFFRRCTIPQAVLNLLERAPVHLLRNPVLLARTSLLQFSVFMIDSLTLLIMLHVVGYPLPPHLVFTAFVMAAVAGAVLPVPLGLGTFEGTAVALLNLFGVPIEAALVAVLLLRGFTFWLPMLPGLWLARKEIRYPVRAPAAGRI